METEDLTFPTKIAQVSLLVRVVTFVDSQVRSSREPFLAEPAFVWLDSHVPPHVNDQIIVPHKSKSALCNQSSRQ